MRVCPRCRSIYATKVQWCGIDNSALVEQNDDPLVGREIERYRIVEPLGVGGMGCVYRASHTFIEREYAIKVLYGDFADDPKFRERFRREAKSISQIRHPNIVFVEDFGTTAEGLTFLAMEMVHGRTLEKAIQQEAPFSPIRAAQITRQIVAGLGAAHSLGFVHRDVKPSNIMLSQQNGIELVKILDFGAVSMRTVPVDQRLTSVGHIIGTPTYMAPEQSQDPNVGPPADLYAAGVILYEMLTGQPPFVGKGRAEVLIKHIMEEPPKAPPSRGLEKIVATLLKKNPDERPQAAVEVIRMIDALGLDIAIISDAPRMSQAAVPTAEIPRRFQADFHSLPARTDPAEEPTPQQDEELRVHDTFPVLGSSDALEWQAWVHDGGTDSLPFADDFEPTARRSVPAEDILEDLASKTIPVDGSLEQTSGDVTDPRMDGNEIADAMESTDDLRATHPVDMRGLLEEQPLPGSARISIRDDGPTQVDFMRMSELQVPSITSDDVVTGDLNAQSGPQPVPNDPLLIDTAKTLSDGDNVPRAMFRPPVDPALRDSAAAEPPPGPTLELNMRGDDFYEESEESGSMRARVIPVLDSSIVQRTARKFPYFTYALIALALAVSIVVAAVVFKRSQAGTPIVIIDDGAQSRAIDPP